MTYMQKSTHAINLINVPSWPPHITRTQMKKENSSPFPALIQSLPATCVRDRDPDFHGGGAFSLSLHFRSMRTCNMQSFSLWLLLLSVMLVTFSHVLAGSCRLLLAVGQRSVGGLLHNLFIPSLLAGICRVSRF